MKKSHLITAIALLSFITLPSCALVTVPLKVAGKAATTTIGVAGKAAGAGIDAISGSDDDSDDE